MAVHAGGSVRLRGRPALLLPGRRSAERRARPSRCREVSALPADGRVRSLRHAGADGGVGAAGEGPALRGDGGIGTLPDVGKSPTVPPLFAARARAHRYGRGGVTGRGPRPSRSPPAGERLSLLSPPPRRVGP